MLYRHHHICDGSCFLESPMKSGVIKLPPAQLPPSLSKAHLHPIPGFLSRVRRGAGPKGLTMCPLDFCSIDFLSELEDFLLPPHLVWHISLPGLYSCFSWMAFPLPLCWNYGMPAGNVMWEWNKKTTLLIFSKYCSCYIA